jgi:hypothetical protein
MHDHPSQWPVKKDFRPPPPEEKRHDTCHEWSRDPRRSEEVRADLQIPHNVRIPYEEGSICGLPQNRGKVGENKCIGVMKGLPRRFNIAARYFIIEDRQKLLAERKDVTIPIEKLTVQQVGFPTRTLEAHQCDHGGMSNMIARSRSFVWIYRVDRLA